MASIVGGVTAAVVAGALLMAGMAMLCEPVAAAEDFGDDVLLDSSGWEPDVATDGQGNVYVVYPQHEGGPIYCRTSEDNGSTFGSPVLVSETGQLPAVAVDGDGNVHVVFEDDTRIYHTISAGPGTGFDSPTMISDDLGANWLHETPAIAIHGDDIYVCWTTWRAGTAESNISFDASIDGGSFGSDGTVNTAPGVVNGPSSIDVDDDGTIAVAWQDDRSGKHAYVARSANQGNSFSAGVQVDSSEGAFQPSVAIHDGVCYVAYQTFSFESGEGRLMCAVGSDGSFARAEVSDVLISTGDVTTFLNDIVVHPCGKVFVVWQDSRNDNEGEIYFATSNDGGATFSSDIRVNDEPPAESYNGHTHPAIAVGSDTEVFVAWWDERTDWQPFFAMAPDGTPPAVIDDLQVTETNATSITLEWTAPGDNLDMETAATYDVRYSTTEITEANWDDATPVTAPTPKAAGAKETMTMANLSSDTTYYMAIKTTDEIPNHSGLSNVASGSTTGDGNGGTPGFEVGIVLLAAGLLLLIRRHRLNL